MSTTCPDCHGTRQYVGLNTVEPCRTCATTPVADQNEPDLIDKIHELAEQYPKRSALREVVYAQNPRDRFFDKLTTALQASDAAADDALVVNTMRRVLGKR